MTTNSTWTTVNGVVMPGSGTQTFANNCASSPFGLPNLGGCGGIPGMAGLAPPPAFYIDNSGNMWVPCTCPTP